MSDNINNDDVGVEHGYGDAIHPAHPGMYCDQYVESLEKIMDSVEEQFYGVIISVTPNGFEFSVPDDMLPVTLAGIGWYLTEMAGIGMRKLMMMQAQAESQANAKKIVPVAAMPRDHLTRGGKRPD